MPTLSKLHLFLTPKIFQQMPLLTLSKPGVKSTKKFRYGNPQHLPVTTIHGTRWVSSFYPKSEKEICATLSKKGFDILPGVWYNILVRRGTPSEGSARARVTCVRVTPVPPTYYQRTGGYA